MSVGERVVEMVVRLVETMKFDSCMRWGDYCRWKVSAFSYRAIGFDSFQLIEVVGQQMRWRGQIAKVCESLSMKQGKRM